ncbi:MAG: hypothetical protein GW759_09400, partial [Cyanobacteria bacterium]|nr:hypothetical protein [Cyanobacteria bacterium CG_2015-02_32_10]
MSDNSQRYSGLSLSQVAYVVSREFVAQQRPWLIVCADRAEADRLVSDIEFFFNGSSVEVFLLPRWEVLPFDVLSPAAEVMGERISALGALAQSRS